MSFGFFAIGCLFLVAGVAYLAHLMQLPQIYVMGSLFILLAIAAVSGIQSMRRTRI
jgi:hypothetical protein